VLFPQHSLISALVFSFSVIARCQDIRGLAELPRLALAASGAEWTDDRLPFSRNADGSFNKGDVSAQHKTQRTEHNRSNGGTSGQMQIA